MIFYRGFLSTAQGVALSFRLMSPVLSATFGKQSILCVL